MKESDTQEKRTARPTTVPPRVGQAVRRDSRSVTSSLSHSREKPVGDAGLIRPHRHELPQAPNNLPPSWSQLPEEWREVLSKSAHLNESRFNKLDAGKKRTVLRDAGQIVAKAVAILNAPFERELERLQKAELMKVCKDIEAEKSKIAAARKGSGLPAPLAWNKADRAWRTFATTAGFTKVKWDALNDGEKRKELRLMKTKVSGMGLPPIANWNKHAEIIDRYLLEPLSPLTKTERMAQEIYAGIGKSHSDGQRTGGKSTSEKYQRNHDEIVKAFLRIARENEHTTTKKLMSGKGWIQDRVFEHFNVKEVEIKKGAITMTVKKTHKKKGFSLRVIKAVTARF